MPTFCYHLLQAFALASQDYYLALEFAHVTIFFAALVFVAQAIFLLAVMKRIVMKWDVYGAQQLGALLREGRRVGEGGSISYKAMGSLCEAMEFHILKHQFIRRALIMIAHMIKV